MLPNGKITKLNRTTKVQTKTTKSANKSSKKRNVELSKEEQQRLWALFDTECLKTEADFKTEGDDAGVGTLECICQNVNKAHTESACSVNEREFCERCNSILVYSDEGFLMCANEKCGIIYKDVLDQGAEWRFYAADDHQNSDPARCGMPINPLLQESSYGCQVLYQGKMTNEMRKLRRFTEWQAMPYKEKTRYDDFQYITIMAQNAGIPKLIIDDAIWYNKRISESEQTFRGDNRDGVIAASIYISCRINNHPITAKELATIFNLDVASATQGCKNAQVILNELENKMENNEKTAFYQTLPISFIERYCSKLNMNYELTQLCKFIAIKIEKHNLMIDNTPHSIAAGIVYFVAQLCKLNISKRDVKNISEISEVTINKVMKKMEKMTSELVPSIILQKYRMTRI